MFFILTKQMILKFLSNSKGSRMSTTILMNTELQFGVVEISDLTDIIRSDYSGDEGSVVNK